MILRWTDAAYGQHYLDRCDEINLLGVWGADDATSVIPDYSTELGIPATLWPSRKPAQHVDRVAVAYVEIDRGDDDTLTGTRIAIIHCITMFILNDQGDTIDTLVRDGDTIGMTRMYQALQGPPGRILRHDENPALT